MSERSKVVVSSGGFLRAITGTVPTGFNYVQELPEMRSGREVKPGSVNVPR